ncbi:MAG: PGPGW domain-containing protein [Candidatus Solibacter sp.]
MAAARRYLRICAGFLMLALGFVMALPLIPGPGILIMAGGLMLLAEDFPWARRSLDWTKRKWQGWRT